MTIEAGVKPGGKLKATLDQVVDLLNKQDLVSELTSRQATPRHELLQSLLVKQQLAEVQRRIAQLHPADLAFVLEGLPLDRRHVVWDLVRPEARGAVLLELSDAVRARLIADMQENEILGAVEHLESEDIADLVPSLSKDTVSALLDTLDREDRSEVQTMLEFPPGTVGSLMVLDVVTVREDVNLDVVLRYLRRRSGLPARIDHIVVVDRGGILQGLLPIRKLLVHDPDVKVHEVLVPDPIFFYTEDAATDAVQAFERYDIITAPVVNLHDRVVGMITVDAVMDYRRETTERDRLKQVGLNQDEDLFAPIWKSAKNRWAWLAINLVTAFIASRVIGVFEGTIDKLVALAALMPIVASIGGNTGNQTVALLIRGLAMDQIHRGNLGYLVYKEIGISIMNGIIWGAVVGAFALVFYSKVSLAALMAVAVLLNLVIASLAGVFIPLGLRWLGRDPVFGSSVMLTAITDSMGFFIFLGLAAAFLI
ncbi:MAG: magnesium transporter [Chromatiales bacterium]